MAFKRLTIPRAEADTFGASAALQLAVQNLYITEEAAKYIESLGSRIACDILSGKTVLTWGDDGNYVEVVLAEEPAIGDWE